MLDRRTFISVVTTAAATRLENVFAAGQQVRKLVFIHGRAQQGRDPVKLKAEWLDALGQGSSKTKLKVPDPLDVSFPFYGDVLDDFAKKSEIPLTADVQERGAKVDEDFLIFQAEMAEAIRSAAGVTDEQIDAEYGPNPRPRGPLNWEWVQAILRAIDSNADGLNAATLQAFTRDVFLYTRRAGVRDEIDRIVATSLTEEPTIVVGHSLGSVVAYNVLRNDSRKLQVPLFVTVGSPLGVRAVRDQFRPLRYPRIGQWYNAFDTRDVVALYPLDATNFPVKPAIENASHVRNGTDNRHGISGYLDDASVAARIVKALM